MSDGPMHIQVCPQCGSEFQPHVTQCIDCGSATETRLESPLAGLEAAAPEVRDDLSVPTEDDACSVRVGDFDAARDLAAWLEEHGVSCRVRRHPANRRAYTVWVAPEDLERALALDREQFAAQVPDAPDMPIELPADRCPACGAQLAPTAPECPDCGLVVDYPSD
jgi:ribosomal protein L40E